VPAIVGFRIYRRKSLGNGHWLGVSKSGLSAGRRGRPVSLSFGRRGLGGSVRLAKGVSYLFGRNRWSEVCSSRSPRLSSSLVVRLRSTPRAQAPTGAAVTVGIAVPAITRLIVGAAFSASPLTRTSGQAASSGASGTKVGPTTARDSASLN